MDEDLETRMQEIMGTLFAWTQPYSVARGTYVRISSPEYPGFTAWARNTPLSIDLGKRIVALQIIQAEE